MDEKDLGTKPLQEKVQTPSQLWEMCLEIFRNSMTRRKFEKSFALVKFQSFDKGELILNVPNYSVQFDMERKCQTLIYDTVEKVFGKRIYLLVYTTGDPSPEELRLKYLEEGTEEAYEAWSEAHYKALMEKNERFRALSPKYQIEAGNVPNNAAMRTLAIFINYCYQGRGKWEMKAYDDSWWGDRFDYDKLQLILKYMYGAETDVFHYFEKHRVADLMQYVEEHTNPACREQLEAFEKWTQEIRNDLLGLLKHHNQGKTFQLECILHFTNINFDAFYLDIYDRYHLIISSYERKNLNTSEEIVNFITWRLWEGGRFGDVKIESLECKTYQNGIENRRCRYTQNER